MFPPSCCPTFRLPARESQLALTAYSCPFPRRPTQAPGRRHLSGVRFSIVAMGHEGSGYCAGSGFHHALRPMDRPGMSDNRATRYFINRYGRGGIPGASPGRMPYPSPDDPGKRMLRFCR